jgi:hypothetical protein
MNWLRGIDVAISGAVLLTGEEALKWVKRP